MKISTPKRSPQASLAFQADADFPLIPRGVLLLRQVNQVHQAQRERRSEDVNRILNELLAELRIYYGEVDEAYKKHPSGPGWGRWHFYVLSSMVYDAVGEFERAYELDLASLSLAPSDTERAKSAINCCSGARRLKLADEAVKFGTLAYQIRPTSDWVLINYALALFQAGAKTEASKMILLLAKLLPPSEQGSVLRAHIKFEEELKEMGELPEVKELLENYEN